ncbi:MAG: fused MFS/spermidine synthase [Gemmatimonadota bacterium]|jgi:spermidine synthase|nr:fused MFS/spermidine synthase [Gemmatimonadota bacterium]
MGELPSSRRFRGIEVLFTLAIFAGAFLLFLVQPMFGKMVLPLLGGSPAVWNACMLFFQVALLAGYLYADAGSRWISPKKQWMLHLVLLGVALALLPISVGAAPAGDAAPIPWLLGTMFLSLGVPFVALSATGPLLQRWFARSGAPGGEEPYHLYAASNLGSMLALLAYPLLVEPRFRLTEQSLVWTGGFVALIGLIAACGIRSRWTGGFIAPDESVRDELNSAEGSRLTVRDRLFWIALAFVPSSLLQGATTYITTDVAPAPLFWVLPLALYLLSFTLAFSRRQLLRRSTLLTLQLIALGGVMVVMLRSDSLRNPSVWIPLHLLALFLTGLVCHGELSQRRPAVNHLTEFYLWVAAGGALGGVFNVLVAPVIFSRLWEYPVVLVLACLVRPWQGIIPGGRRYALSWALRAAGVAALLVMLTDPRFNVLPVWGFLAVALLSGYLATRILGSAPFWLALSLVLALTFRMTTQIRTENTLLVERSFYGQFRVNRPEGYTLLLHGSTLHGVQSTNPDRRRVPLSYYAEGGPFWQLMSAVRATNPTLRVAVVGLGTGSTAAYAAPGDDWTFYELDPNIIRVARDTSLFTFLADSPAPVRVKAGDARLSIQSEEPGRQFDLIVLDAFSSDAIPTHLLTLEAMQVFLDRLAPGGRITIHISNRYIDLRPVLEASARTLGLATRIESGPIIIVEGSYTTVATWVAIARDPADLEGLTDEDGWMDLQPTRRIEPWTDDFTSLWPVMRW